MSVGTPYDDLFHGSSGADIADGRGGDDTLQGFGGDDSLSGSSGFDLLDGGAGADVLDGGTGHDLLLGGRDNDSLDGGAGNDDLVGEGGQDFLTGGAGNDWFYFDRVSDSTRRTMDRITDLEDDFDRIVLNRIDADTGQSGNQAFHLVDAFTGDAGELTVTWNAARNRTEIQGDVDGDGRADLIIWATGNHETFDNFTL